MFNFIFIQALLKVLCTSQKNLLLFYTADDMGEEPNKVGGAVWLNKPTICLIYENNITTCIIAAKATVPYVLMIFQTLFIHFKVICLLFVLVKLFSECWAKNAEDLSLTAAELRLTAAESPAAKSGGTFFGIIHCASVIKKTIGKFVGAWRSS